VRPVRAGARNSSQKFALPQVRRANVHGTQKMAERQGFEPWVELPLHRFSKSASSTELAFSARIQDFEAAEPPLSAPVGGPAERIAEVLAGPQGDYLARSPPPTAYQLPLSYGIICVVPWALR